MKHSIALQSVVTATMSIAIVSRIFVGISVWWHVGLFVVDAIALTWLLKGLRERFEEDVFRHERSVTREAFLRRRVGVIMHMFFEADMFSSYAPWLVYLILVPLQFVYLPYLVLMGAILFTLWVIDVIEGVRIRVAISKDKSRDRK